MTRQAPFDANQWAHDMLDRIDAMRDGFVCLVDENIVDDDDAARAARKQWRSTANSAATSQRRSLTGVVLPSMRHKLQTGTPDDFREAMDMRLAFEADLDRLQRTPRDILAQIQGERG